MSPDESSNAKLFAATILVVSVVVTCLVVGVAMSSLGNDYFPIGFSLGAMFAYSILAGAWIGLGPGKLFLRLGVGGLWPFLIPVLLLSVMGNDTSVIFLSSALITFVVLVITLVARFFFGCRVKKFELISQADESKSAPIQFGIRQLLILTTASAVFLTIGRAVLQYLPERISGELPVFVFLSLSIILVCMPVVFSIMLHRRYLVSTIATLAFGVLITAWQSPLFKQLIGDTRPDWLDIALINGFTVLQILAFVGTLRFLGYGFQASQQVSGELAGDWTQHRE